MKEAEAEFGQAIGLKPDAAADLKRWQESSAGDSGLSKLLDQLEHVLRQEPMSPAGLNDAEPAEAAVCLNMAILCQQSKRYAAAARFYHMAFRTSPLLGNVYTGDRYHAARCAALAACGQGIDAPAAEQDRVALRGATMIFLDGDLNIWKQHLKSPLPEDRLHARNALGEWLNDPDLAGLRDPDGLAKLPDRERIAWLQFWGNVKAVLLTSYPP